VVVTVVFLVWVKICVPSSVVVTLEDSSRTTSTLGSSSRPNVHAINCGSLICDSISSGDCSRSNLGVDSRIISDSSSNLLSNCCMFSLTCVEYDVVLVVVDFLIIDSCVVVSVVVVLSSSSAATAAKSSVLCDYYRLVRVLLWCEFFFFSYSFFGHKFFLYLLRLAVFINPFQSGIT